MTLRRYLLVTVLFAMPVAANASPDAKADLPSDFANALTADAHKQKAPIAIQVATAPAAASNSGASATRTPTIVDIQVAAPPEVSQLAKLTEIHLDEVRHVGAASTYRLVVKPATPAAAELGLATSEAVAKIPNLISFESGRLRIYSAGREKIQAVAASWKANTAWATITVDGYADAKGRTDAEKLALAQQRADLVRGYLLRYGVPAEQVIAVGHATANSGKQIDLAIAGCADTDCKK